MVAKRGQYVVVIDAGTTSIRVVCYDTQLRVVDSRQQEFTQYYPQPGWVEHDAQEIWAVTQRLLNRVLRGRQQCVAAIGITNQRETTVVWNAVSGRPIHRAIVWQDRRTSDRCVSLRHQGNESMIQQRTGLRCDPYFSAPKVQWILEQIRGRSRKASTRRAAIDQLRFGTIDSWLIWNFSGGRVHATDYTNASRTMLYNIRTHQWDRDLLRLFHIPYSLLPEVRHCQDNYGTYRGIPITGVAGDQQAALFGQGAWSAGMAKNTYGTGCFLLMATGSRMVRSRHGLLTTLASDSHGRPQYALEGSVFMGGALIQWLRDQVRLIHSSADAGPIASTVQDTHGAVIVPAFTGLGAPYWDAHARGLITGLTRGVTAAHLVRAAEEAIAHQVVDVVVAMEQDSGRRLKSIIVDGGAARDSFLLQFQADVLGVAVRRSQDCEATARGAAIHAGLAVGLWKQSQDVLPLIKTDRVFRPGLSAKKRAHLRQQWTAAVAQTRHHSTYSSVD